MHVGCKRQCIRFGTLEIRKGSQEQGSGMGFAAFILGIFGVTADVIRKLSDMEKCVLLFVKEDAVLASEGKYTLRDSLPCVNYARECGCRQYDKRSLPEDILTDTVQKLLEKNIIKQTGNSLEYRF